MTKFPPARNQDILDYHYFDSKSIPDQGPPIENIARLDRNPSIGDSMEIDLDIDEKIPTVDIENHNILEGVEISMLDVSVCSLSDSVLDDGVGEFVLNSESMFDINPPILDRTPPLLDRTPPLGDLSTPNLSFQSSQSESQSHLSFNECSANNILMIFALKMLIS